MADKIEVLPPRWISEGAKLEYEALEFQRTEIIKTFTVPPEAIGAISSDRVVEVQRKMHEATETLVARMVDLFARNTVPQDLVIRACKCHGIVHESGCPEMTN